MRCAAVTAKEAVPLRFRHIAAPFHPFETLKQVNPMFADFSAGKATTDFLTVSVMLNHAVFPILI